MGALALPSSGDAGKLVCGMEVLKGDTVMVVTAGGVVTRLKGSEIPEQGRRTQGSRLVKLGRGDRVVEVVRGQAGRNPDGPAPRPDEPSSGPDQSSAGMEGPAPAPEDVGSPEGPSPESQLDLLGEKGD
jgi:DNA gyrase subunit A